MEKKAIEHLEQLYKDELDSHELKKAINNIDIMSLKSKDFQINKKLSSKNSKNFNENNPRIKSTLIFKKKLEKDSININLYKPKEEDDKNLIEYSHSDGSKKEEDEIKTGTNFKKRNNVALKVCKTFKNCGENINKAKILLFNKNNNKNTERPTKTIKRFSTKNCLSSKRGTLLQSSKKFKKLKEKISPKIENDYILKTKKTYYQPIIISDFQYEKHEKENENNKESINNYYKDNKESANNIINQFRKRTKSNYIKNGLKIQSNNQRKKSPHENYKTNKNINYLEIKDDTGNEVENNLLCLLDKSFKNNRNSVINNKKHNHYGTVEVGHDKFLKNLNNYLDDRKITLNDIGKISNSNSISIIKQTELHNYNLNNIGDEFADNHLVGNSGKLNNKLKHISTQKVGSFDSKEEDEINDDENINNNQNIQNNNSKSIKNKKKKNVIIYNNINYFRNTQKEDDDDNIVNKQNSNMIKNEEKNDSISTYNKKSTKKYSCSFFNCCFLLD